MSGSHVSTSRIVTPLPDKHYNNDRDSHDRLTSDDVFIEVELSEAVRRCLEEDLNRARKAGASQRTDIWTGVLRRFVAVEVVRFDGTPLQTYVPGANGSLGHVSVIPAPKVKFDSRLPSSGMIPSVIGIHIEREFPLSSAHGNAPMRMVVSVASELIYTSPFMVCAKKPVSGTVEKVRRLPVVPVVTQSRQDRLAAIATALQPPCKPGHGTVVIKTGLFAPEMPTVAVVPQAPAPVRKLKRQRQEMPSAQSPGVVKLDVSAPLLARQSSVSKLMEAIPAPYRHHVLSRGSSVGSVDGSGSAAPTPFPWCGQDGTGFGLTLTPTWEGMCPSGTRSASSGSFGDLTYDFGVDNAEPLMFVSELSPKPTE